MNYTKPTTAKSSHKTSTSSAASSTATTAASSPCGCGCHGHAPADEGCCKLTCFERPKYFCGQLLSDADLTLEETYFREKNKLYHRTMDGFGVVCGLRMYCDGECRGHVTVGDGYAIDCCGNDLVVCEPRRFDVIAELRKKKWLVEMPRDPCHEHDHQRGHEYSDKDKRDKDRNKDHDKDHHRHEDDCFIKQCFYIGICYAEEPVDFATPYTTECSPAPGPCQPTRIREGVRFEIYDELPVRPNPLDDIAKRIESCFRIFREGQFSRGLQLLAPRILRVLCDEQTPRSDQTQQNPEKSDADKPDCLFAELRAQFLHELRTCPDQYNCNLEEQVCRLRPPHPDNYEYGPPPLEAFTKLFELIQRHVFSCVLAQFAFLCPEPPDPCCVLIGAVEIENGRLTRVINYPRWYLWCFKNFFEVLVYTLANEAACHKEKKGNEGDTLHPSKEKDGKPCSDGCCPDIEVDVCDFLKLFDAENRAGEYAALTSVKAMQAVHQALVAGFDFMKPHGIAPAVLNNLSFERAQKLAKELNFSLLSLGEPPSEQRDPISALLANLVHRGADPIAYFEHGGRVTGATNIMDASALSISRPPDSASHVEVRALLDRIKQMEEDLRSFKESVPRPPDDEAHVLRDRIQTLEGDLRNLRESPTKAPDDESRDLQDRIQQLESYLRNLQVPPREPPGNEAQAMEHRIQRLEQNLRNLSEPWVDRLKRLWKRISRS